MARPIMLHVLAGSHATAFDTLPRLLAYTYEATPWPRWIAFTLHQPLDDERQGRRRWEQCYRLLHHRYHRAQPVQVLLRTVRQRHWRWVPLARGIPSEIRFETAGTREGGDWYVDLPSSLKIVLALPATRPTPRVKW